MCYIQSINAWLNKQKYEGNIGHIAFLLVYLAANFVAGYTHYVENVGPGVLVLVGFAKLFGNLLNLNCAFIALPVARTIIRWYDYCVSTVICVPIEV